MILRHHLRSLCVMLALTGASSPGLAETSGRDLLNAIARDETSAILALLETYPRGQINYPVGRKGATLLHSVLSRRRNNRSDRILLVRQLVDKGADINRPDDTGTTPLYLVPHAPDPQKLLEVMVELGANVQHADHKGTTPLHRFISFKQTPLALALLEHGVALDAADHKGQTALMLAAAGRMTSVMARLVELGANPLMVDKAGNGLAHYGARSGDVRVLDVVAEVGASLEHANNKGQTALSVLAGTGRWSAVRLLIERGVNVNVPFSRGTTVGLHLLTHRELGMHELVRTSNLDLMAKDKRGNTQLDHAVVRGDLGAIQQLQSVGLDLSAAVASKPSLLARAASLAPQRYPDANAILALLLAHAGGPPYPSGRQSPLLAAARGGHLVHVKTLLAHQFPVVDTDLYAVMKDRKYGVALVLLEAGGAVDFQSAALWKLLHTATRQVERDEERGVASDAKQLVTTLFAVKPTVVLNPRNRSRVTAARKRMEASGSVALINALVNVTFVDEQKPVRSFSPQDRAQLVKSLTDTRTRKQSPVTPNTSTEPYPTLTLSEQAKVHVIGIGQGISDNPDDERPWWANCLDEKGQPAANMIACHQKFAGRTVMKPVRVSVFAKQAPTALVLMAYEPVDWQLTFEPGARIEAVVLAGYHGQRLHGVSDKIQVVAYTAKPSDCGRCQVVSDYFHGHKTGSKALRGALKKISAITGKPVASLQTARRGKRFSVID